MFESNNTFLYDLCQYMIFTLGKFLANIYTFITHGLAQTSNTDTLLTYGFSPHSLFFPITYINHCHTQTLFFPIYGIQIPKQHSKLTLIHGNTITKLISCHCSDRVTSKTPVIFLHIFFYFLFSFLFFGGEGALVKILLRYFTHEI